MMLNKPTYGKLAKRVEELESQLSQREMFLNGIPDHMVIQNIEQKILWANKAARDSIGKKDEDIVGKYCFEIWQQRDTPCEGCPIIAMIRTGHFKEKDMSTPDGRTFRVRGYPMHDADGKIVGAFEYGFDITELRQAQKKLQLSEEKYRLLVENQADLVIHADPMRKILYANPSYCKMFGKNAKDIRGRDFTRLIHPKDVDRIVLSPESLATPPHVTYHEERAKTVDGWKWLAWSVKGIVDDDGKLSEIFAIGRDISELRLADEKLLKKQTQLEQIIKIGTLANSTLDLKVVLEKILKGTLDILDASVGMIFLKDQDDGCLSWGASIGLSENFVKAYRNRPVQPGEGLTGRIAETGEPIYIKEDSSHDPRITRSVIREEGFDSFIGVPLFAADEIVGVMNVLCKAPGHLSEDNKYLCVAIGSHVGMAIRNAKLFTSKEQTEKSLKDSEYKFRSMMEAMKDPFYICSPEFIVEYMNPAMVKRVGHDATGECCFKSLHGLDERCPWCQFHPDNERIFSDIEIVSPLDNRSYLLSQNPIVHDDGTVSKMTVYKDITDLKKVEDRLRQAQKMESVGRLAGGVAHDFNNMLSVILGNAEIILEETEPSQPLYENVQEIQNAAKRSADVTRQLLAFARKQTIAPRVIDLNKTVDATLNMLHRMIGEDIAFQWLPGEKIWPIRIDPSQLDQILANLTINARDAIAGVGHVTIKTNNVTFDENYCSDHPSFVPGDFVQLEVGDTGCGMDQETLKHVFEPFYTTKSKDKGTGLGLATVYGIVKQNGGFINVDSAPGEGTSFRIHFPRYQAAFQQMLEKNDLESELKGHETILLVEDELSILKMTAMILERLGYTVLTANLPGEALRLAREYDGEIHLVLADVVMPEMDGRDLARNLLPIFPKLKRLFMSGYTADVIAHHGVLDEGINFIQKPFSMHSLAVKLRDVLHDEAPNGR